MLFAWKVARMAKSNAIVYAAEGRTLGVGAGQMSRVDSARIARWKAADAGLTSKRRRWRLMHSSLSGMVSTPRPRPVSRPLFNPAAPCVMTK